jgi:hypothetical protein
MKLFFVGLAALSLGMPAYAQTSSAESLSHLSPKKQAIAKASMRYQIMVATSDGQAPPAQNMPFISQLQAECDTYAVTQLASGAVTTARRVAEAKLSCVRTNLQHANLPLVATLLTSAG